MNFVDRSGQFPETLWDIANVVMDVKSLASNLRQGKIGAAIVDGVGLTLDAAAAALPFVPGGVGTGIKATRLADNALDAVGNVKDTGKSLSRIKEALIEAKSRIGLSPNESLP